MYDGGTLMIMTTTMKNGNICQNDRHIQTAMDNNE
jgi:hypothetical protein